MYQKVLSIAVRMQTYAILPVALKKIKSVCIEVKLQMKRAAVITSIEFEFEGLSEEECYRQYRFKKDDVRKIESFLVWEGGTARKKYRCDSIKATCIFLRRLAYPCRSKDLEVVYGMHTSGLSEVFHDCLQLFVDKYGKLVLIFKTEVMRRYAGKYAEVVIERRVALQNCV